MKVKEPYPWRLCREERPSWDVGGGPSDAWNVYGMLGPSSYDGDLAGAQQLSDIGPIAAQLGHLDIASVPGEAAELANCEIPWTFLGKGTLVRTIDGEVAIEDIRVGDLVSVLSVSYRLVRSVGLYHLGRLPALRQDIQPVCIRADALGKGRPANDLYLSPYHAVALTCVQDILVPIHCLLSGDAVAQVEPGTTAFWHIELDAHDVMIANGLPVESFVPGDSRDVVKRLASGFKSRSGTELCRPLVEEGPILSALRAGLFGELSAETQPSEDVCLIVDGIRLPPEEMGQNGLTFQFAADARDVRLVSPSFQVPPDIRTLGISLSAIVISDGQTRRDIALDNLGLVAGFNKVECGRNGPWRWTKGEAHFSSSLWKDLLGRVTLEFKGNFDPQGKRSKSGT